MTTNYERLFSETRRHFFRHGGQAVGLAALMSLMNESGAAGLQDETASADASVISHPPTRAKRVIYLFQSGAPSQIDLFDHKPGLANIPTTYPTRLPQKTAGSQKGS